MAAEVKERAGGREGRLHDSVALVTGGRGHLGAAMVSALAREGATVLVNGRDGQSLDEWIRSQPEDVSARCIATPFDVSDRSAVERGVGVTAARFPAIDVLVNNAYAPPGEDSLPFQRAAQLVNDAAWQLTAAMMPQLREAAKRRNGGSSVINIASMYGIVSPDPRAYTDTTLPNPPFYGAAKAGLIQLTRYMACAFAGDSVRVNSISPGAFPAAAAQSDAGFIRNLEARIPIGRIGQPSEIGGPVVFLASEESSYVNGADLRVDGGWTAW